MWFRIFAASPTSRPPAAQRPARVLRLEQLEDRRVFAVDPVGDFLPTYTTGPQLPGMDVVEYDVVLVEDRMVFSGRMAGSIAATEEIGGLYLVGVDRGQGTPRFTTGTPVIGPNVTWDLIVRVNPNGTGLVNNQIAGVITPLDPANIQIEGDSFTASVPLSLLMPAATLPPEEWTYNLWPRNSVIIGQNQHVSDLAPDDGNAPVRVVAPTKIESVVVNDGSLQRSMVDSLTVTFDGPVMLDAGAFELRRDDDSLVELSVAASLVDGRTVAVLTFAGPDVIGGSLADGNYSLTIRGDLVHNAYGRALDGDADGTAGGDAAEAFFRLYGDSDGDRDVDLHDLGEFLGTLGRRRGDSRYLEYLDFNDDARVGLVDLLAFARRLGTKLET
jgi:hypothetical protein